MRPQVPSLRLPFVLPTILSLASLCASPSQAEAHPPCSAAPPDPSSLPALFEKELDATQPFVLEVRMVHPPAGWNVSLVYVARRGDDAVVAINPTLVAVPGATLRFHLENCLQAAEIQAIAGYNPLDGAGPDSNPPGSFKVIQAMEMTPTGYVNVHTHGLHGGPLGGTPGSAAADEVLTTFIAPVGKPSSDTSVSSRQEYSIAIPRNQDAGLYWYHPHLHGEAQPQVFLGLTGAIVVVRRFRHDPDGSQAIASELRKHSDPSLLPAVFIVRDYPVEKFPSTTASIPAPGASQTPTSSRQAMQTSRRHRAQFLESPGRGALEPAAVPGSGAPPDDPLCSTFGAPYGSLLCPVDHVTPKSDDQAPALATLVTVNGRITEIPVGTDPHGDTASLHFQPISASWSDRNLRVLNASANTYVRLALSTSPLSSVDLSKASTTATATQPLLQLRRDGAPVRHHLRAVNSILVPPGGRAEFTSAGPISAPLSLVSLFFDTGAAGDTVPPRTLANLATPPAIAPAVAVRATSVPELSGRFQSAYLHAKPKDTRRAFAFYEQDRPCSATAEAPDPDCGTSFYLIDVTSSAIGVHGQKHAVTEAVPFSMPMNADMTPSRDMFQANGLFKPSTPAIQVELRGRHEVDEEWDVYNFTAEAHAFHIHQLGFHVTQACSPQFLALHGLPGNCVAYTGKAGDEHRETGLVLDVINVPPAYSKTVADGPALIYPGKVHLRVPFTSDIAGNFLMHCHLLEHEDNGMMLGVQVWKQTIPHQAAVLGSSPPTSMSMSESDH